MISLRSRRFNCHQLSVVLRRECRDVAFVTANYLLYCYRLIVSSFTLILTTLLYSWNLPQEDSIGAFGSIAIHSSSSRYFYVNFSSVSQIVLF